MILQVSPTSPWWEHVAAGALLAIHVGAGAIGLMSGTAAVLATKGGKLHRAAGTAFFASMLVMSGIGMAVAPFLPQLGSEIGGSFTFYLVFTGWLAVWRAPNSVGNAERVAAVCALLIALAAASFGVRATRLPGGELDGTPAGPYFAFATLAALAGALDWRVVVKGGLSGTSPWLAASLAAPKPRKGVENHRISRPRRTFELSQKRTFELSSYTLCRVQLQMAPFSAK